MAQAMHKWSTETMKHIWSKETMTQIEADCQLKDISLDTAYMVSINWFVSELFDTPELHTHVKENIMPCIVVVTYIYELPVTFLCNEEMLTYLELSFGVVFSIKYTEWLTHNNKPDKPKRLL